MRNLKLVYLQNFAKKQKCLNLGTNMPVLGVFWLERENNIVISEVSAHKFLRLQIFAKKQKIAKTSYLVIFGEKF